VATALEELANLKLRALRSKGREVVTLIDHTADARFNFPISEALKHLANLVEKGQGQNHIHVVYVEQEKARQRANPNQSTRVTFETGSPQLYKDFHEQRQRFCDLAKDAGMGLYVLIRALKETEDETILSWLHEGEEEEPEWMR
jgi:hypothetical protein